MSDSNNSQGGCQQTGVIYKITCLVTGKPYVGKTKQKLKNRMAQHRCESKKGSIGLGAAIRKYGWENFTVEVIEVCPVEKLNEREMFWICELNSKAPNGYNLTDGGEGNSNPSAETRAKMSANHPDITGEKNPNYGKKTPPEVCAKISAGNKGKKMSEEQKRKLSAARKGKKYGSRPPEVCAKIATALKEYRAKKKLESEKKS